MSSKSRSGLAIKHLAALFNRNGYVRPQNKAKATTLGRERYKKGTELRFIARSTSELRSIRRWLSDAGFQAGRAFTKGRQFVQPIYGRAAVDRLLSLINLKPGT